MQSSGDKGHICIEMGLLCTSGMYGASAVYIQEDTKENGEHRRTKGVDPDGVKAPTAKMVFILFVLCSGLFHFISRAALCNKCSGSFLWT